MKYIYIDHNILVYLAESQNQSEELALSNILHSQKAKFVFSLWNLAEIVNGENDFQAKNLAKFIDRLQPNWILERRNIQKEEVKNYLFDRYYYKGRSDFFPIKVFLSEILHYLNPTITLINVSAEKVVNAWLRNPLCMSEIESIKDVMPEILSTLQNAKKNGLYTKEIQLEVEKNYLADLIPIITPDSKVVNQQEKEKITQFLLKNIKDLYKKSLCLSVENKISEFRVLDSNRKPEKQDAIDLQHAVPALAYCDFFVTNDGYLRSGAEYVKKHCSLLNLNICKNLSEVYASILLVAP